jgi:predicted phosphodiesterase
MLWRFLWITDLHYELPDANYLDDPKELQSFERAYEENAFDLFYKILGTKELKNSLSFIAIGGDVTSHGIPRGIQKFKLHGLPKLQKLVRSEAICIVPGNHDVAWGLDPTAPGYFDDKFKVFRDMVDVTGMSSCLFPAGELHDLDPAHDPKLVFSLPPLGVPWYKDDAKRVFVLNINSALRCGELNKRMVADIQNYVATKLPTSGFKLQGNEKDLKRYFIRDVAQITPGQITELEKMIDDLRGNLDHPWESYLRVALVHHHVVHYPGQQIEHKGYEFMVDSPRLLDFLKHYDFDIVLTGHKHQAYQDVHRWKEKEIFVIGGPTVGGYSQQEFRGIRLVTVESNQSERRVEIQNLNLKLANDPQELMSEGKLKPLISRIPPETILKRAAAEKGYSYREVASITNLAQDGDAHRIVECEDLIIKDESCPRAQTHPLHFPPTSGYLDRLLVTGANHTVIPSGDFPEDRSAKTSDDLFLSFDPPLSSNKKVSYRYEWLAVNGFAMDKLQYTRKYGSQGRMRNIEYTHLIPEDPIEELTVVVQFPEGFKLSKPPRLRIAKVNKKQADSRLWEVDRPTERFLEDNHALRYYESINIAALRVKTPDAALAYGIQWDLPDAPAREGVERLRNILERLCGDEDACLKTLARVLEASREMLLQGWNGELDGCIMAFQMYPEGSGSVGGALHVTLAVRQRPAKLDGSHLLAQDILKLRGKVIPYGLGIAGRAFKANRIRLYIANPQKSPSATFDTSDRIEPDYYLPVPGTLSHKTVIVLPLHVPVEDEIFLDKPAVYATREPYGVLNIGSESDQCPVAKLLREGEYQLLHFQHLVNKKMFAELSSR